MNFKQLFFFTVFLVCYVHSYRSESERNPPEYEPTMDKTQNNEEPIGTPSPKRADRETSGIVDQSEEFSQPEEGFEQKPNKKDKHFGQTFDTKSYRNGKKSTYTETGAENVYNKEYKNVSNKKSNGKGYKKYNKQNPEQKVNYDDSGPEFTADEQPPHESIHKRFSPSPKVTDSKPLDRIERSVNLEEEPIAEEKPQETKYQNKEKNRKSDQKSGKYGKNGKQSQKKNSSKRQKRSSSRKNGYFGFWA